MTIRGMLGHDVNYIETATLGDGTGFREILREHPGAAVVVFSAPFYPKP